MRLVVVAGPPRPATARQPDGALEERLVGLADDLLATLGGSWQDPPVLADGWERDPILAEHRRRLDDLLTHHGGTAPLIWEDPRAGLILPLLDEVAEVAASVIVVTHPEDVVRRLVDDEAMELDAAAHLWLRYLVAGWRGAPTPIVLTTAELRRDPDAALDRAVELAGPGCDRGALREAVARADLAEGDGLAPSRPVGHVIGGTVVQLARVVRRLVADEHGERTERVDAAIEALHRGWLAEAEAQRAGDRAEVALRALGEERARTTRLEAETEELRRQVQRVERRWAVTAKEATAREDELAREAQHLRGELRRMEEQVEELVRDYDRLRRRRLVKAALAFADGVKPAVGKAKAVKRRLTGGRSGAAAADRETEAGTEVPGARVFTVLLNYQHADDTVQCLASLQSSTVRTQWVVVVDNGSGDEVVQRLTSELGARTFIDAGDNLGYAAGNNLGIRHAIDRDAEFVWILNPDTTVEDDTLEQLLRTMEEHPDCGIVGARILNGGSQPLTIATDGGLVDWSTGGATDHINVGRPDADVPAGDAHPVDYVPGACMLIRRAVLEDVGLLPEEWFLYFEETDFNLRVAAEGWRLLVNPRARVHHHKRSSGSLPSAYYVYYFVRNRMLFAQRHGHGEGGIPEDLERWISAWREKVARADASWVATYERLVETALDDAREGVTGRRDDVSEVAAGGDARG